MIVSTDMAMDLNGGWRATDDVDDGRAVGMALADKTLDVRLGAMHMLPLDHALAFLIRAIATLLGVASLTFAVWLLRAMSYRA